MDSSTGTGSCTDAADDLVGVVGENLRRLRTKRGLSLDRLAKASGVSRAMLGQIELGRSAPTINLLWKIAKSLDLPFSALIADTPTAKPTLLRRSGAKILLSPDGHFSSRALFPYDGPRRVEFYELRLSAHSEAASDPHPAGTTENLVVNRGLLDVRLGLETCRLERGDAFLFEADQPHTYANPGPEEGLYYLVMTYIDDIG